MIASVLVSTFFYNSLPFQMASHWDKNNNVDGFILKPFGAFLMPALLTVFLILFNFLPLLDPLKKNIDKFRKYFDNFIFALFLFLFILHVQMILWNIGFKINFSLTMPFLLSMLFYYVGVLCEKSKRNWFIGVRTPWTLSSDLVWEKTNKLVSKLFKISSVFILLAIFFENIVFWLIITLIVFLVLFSYVYSFILYKNQK